MNHPDQITYRYPVSVQVLAGNVVDAENLLLQKELQSCDYEPNGTTVTGPCALLLDFGQELCGGLRIICECANKVGSQVRLVFGESVAEAMSDVEASSATNDHSARDFTARTTMLSDVSYGQTGFRYVRVIFPEEAYQVKIIAMVAGAVTTGQPIVGSFCCSDPLINDIYNTAIRTVHLCLQNSYLWDGIKRDRVVWLGDMNPEIKALNTMYVDCPNVENSLEFVLRHTPEGGWINNIPAYSTWWVINLRDYCFHTGNYQFIEQHFEEVRKIVLQFTRAARKQWDFPEVAYTVMPWYLDWPTYDDSGDSRIGIFALLKLAIKAAEEMSHVIGQRIPELDELANSVPDCSYNGSFKQITALSAFAGDIPYEEAAKWIAKDGAKGFSTFQSYYMLKAMAEGGRLAEAVDCAKSYFGKMLEMGATTFWEDFDIRWCEGATPLTEKKAEGKPHIHEDFGRHCYVGLRHSLCHGWASGVAAFLVEYVLGVREVFDGTPTLQIPEATGVPIAASGWVPTARGLLFVERDATGKLVRVQEKTNC